VVDGPIAREDIPGLCARVSGLLEASDAPLVICDVGALEQPDAATVDALAQLQPGLALAVDALRDIARP
jgi:hypothetical protein